MTNLEIDPPGHIAVAAAPGTAGAITSKKTGPFPIHYANDKHALTQ